MSLGWMGRSRKPVLAGIWSVQVLPTCAVLQESTSAGSIWCSEVLLSTACALLASMMLRQAGILKGGKTSEKKPDQAMAHKVSAKCNVVLAHM